jgi:hypothetical protein
MLIVVCHRNTRVAIDHVCAIRFSEVSRTLAREFSKLEKLERDEGTRKKTETVTVRFDPHLKYLAELAARKHRRPLSNFIEWCVQQAVSNVVIALDKDDLEITLTDADRELHLWDLDEPERLIRLALNYPDLLNLEEQMLWRVLHSSGYFWKGTLFGDPPDWDWMVNLRSVEWERVREYWDLLRAVAAGKVSKSVLPKPPETPGIKL